MFLAHSALIGCVASLSVGKSIVSTSPANQVFVAVVMSAAAQGCSVKLPLILVLLLCWALVNATLVLRSFLALGAD